MAPAWYGEVRMLEGALQAPWVHRSQPGSTGLATGATRVPRHAVSARHWAQAGLQPA